MVDYYSIIHMIQVGNIGNIGIGLTMLGFIVGLGAVIVIDICGALGTRWTYWTQTAIRVHKVTKPLIWTGMVLLVVGYGFMWRGAVLRYDELVLSVGIMAIMVGNGLFLSGVVSPRLYALERAKQDTHVLPTSLQIKIGISFIISVCSWWSLFYIFFRIITQ